MKKIITSIFLIVLFPALNLKAQFHSGMCYTFDVSTATLPGFPLGFTNIIFDSTMQDEGNYLVPVYNSWSFDFAGTSYGKVVVSTNGWLALVPDTTTVIPPSISPLPVNQLSNNMTGFPIIAPLWDDNKTIVVSWIPTLTNELWVRWSSKWNNSDSTYVTFASCKLDGNDGSITFYYANLPSYTPMAPHASIGVAGTVPGEFYSLNVTAGNNAYADSVNENVDIGMGGPTTMRPNNATFVFSKCLVSGVEDAATAGFRAYSTNGKVMIDWQQMNGGSGVFQLFDITGREVLRKSERVNAGKNSITMDAYKLRSGIYYLAATVNDVHVSRRIILER